MVFEQREGRRDGCGTPLRFGELRHEDRVGKEAPNRQGSAGRGKPRLAAPKKSSPAESLRFLHLPWLEYPPYCPNPVLAL